MDIDPKEEADFEAQMRAWLEGHQPPRIRIEQDACKARTYPHSQPTACLDCKGKGKVTLFTDIVRCSACRQ